MAESSRKINSFAIVEETNENAEKKLVYDNLCNFNSKYKNDLLKCIFVKERVSNKELAEYLSITPSGLNPVITRLLNLEPLVILEEPMGRQKFYQLTRIAKEVIEEYALLDTTKYEEKKPVNALVELVKRVQKILGDKWELVLDDYYANGKTVDAIAQKAIEEFESELKYAALNEGKEKIEEAKKYIGNRILAFRIEARVAQFAERYRSLGKLCDLDDGDDVDAFVFVDDVCKPLLDKDKQEEFINSGEKYGINDQNELKEILKKMETMYEESKLMGKEDIFKIWKEDFPEKHRKLIFYIVEKFSELYQEEIRRSKENDIIKSRRGNNITA